MNTHHPRIHLYEGHMPALLDFEVWKDMYKRQIEDILRVMTRYMNTARLPKHLLIEYYYHENMDPRILRYIYDHSSSKYFVRHE